MTQITWTQNTTKSVFLYFCFSVVQMNIYCCILLPGLIHHFTFCDLHHRATWTLVQIPVTIQYLNSGDSQRIRLRFPGTEGVVIYSRTHTQVTDDEREGGSLWEIAVLTVQDQQVVLTVVERFSLFSHHSNPECLKRWVCTRVCLSAVRPAPRNRTKKGAHRYLLWKSRFKSSLSAAAWAD